MQAPVLVQPPPLLALALHRVPAHPPIMDKKRPPAPKSGPISSSALHALLDDHVLRSVPRDRMPLTSPRQDSVSVAPTSWPPTLPHPPRTLSTTQTESSAPIPISHSPPQQQNRVTPLFSPPYCAPHNLDHLASSATSNSPNMDRYSIANLADRYIRGTDKYSHNQNPLLDQRRMSEPTMYGSAASGYPSNAAGHSNARYHQHQHHPSYAPPRSYGTHSPSPLHRSSAPRPTSDSSWKEDHSLPSHPYDSLELEAPLSPLNPTFSGGESPPPMGMSAPMYGSFYEDYGPSPPGTGTSTSSDLSTIDMQQQGHTSGGSPSNNKQYSFVSLPGNAVKKRPRRRYEEIERLYQCSWPDCTKAYGTLNHLNAHITMQKHGPKRSPNEFKELRKQWRQTKKEEAEARALEDARHGSYHNSSPSQHSTSRHSMPHPEYQTHNTRAPFDYPQHPERPSQPVGPIDNIHAPHPRDLYSRRRYESLVSSAPQHSGVGYSQPHAQGANTSSVHLNRLPSNSTLLTPLPSYQSSSMGGVLNVDAYGSYNSHRSDSHPRTGYSSSGAHGDRGRLR